MNNIAADPASWIEAGREYTHSAVAGEGNGARCALARCAGWQLEGQSLAEAGHGAGDGVQHP